MKPLKYGLIAAAALFTLTACVSTVMSDSKDYNSEMSENIEQQPISSLMGKQVRAYSTGSPLTMDFNEERVNIELDNEGKVIRIWKG
jgi:hypothetical protein